MDQIQNQNNNKYSPPIRQAIQYIRENYPREIKLMVLAQQVGLSSNHFCTLFHLETGKSFLDYLHALQIEHAGELLAGSDFRVSKIAQKIGYRDAKYFSKVFQKYQNCSPSEYRKKTVSLSLGGEMMRWNQILLLGILGLMLAGGCAAPKKSSSAGASWETIHILGVVGVHETIINSIAKKMAAFHIKIAKDLYYWDTYLAKSKMEIITDTRRYDLILGPCSQLSGFYQSGKLLPLEDVAVRAQLKVDKLYPPIQKSIVGNGELYCLPYLADALIYIYRTDLFQKAGLTPPQTIEAMYHTGKRLTSGRVSGLAFPAGPGEGAASIWSYFLWSYDGQYFNTKLYPTINALQAITATRIYNRILTGCAPPEVATWQAEDTTNSFAAGRLAAMILWSGVANLLDDQNRSKVAGKTGYASLPPGPGGQAVPRLEAWGAIIPRAGQHLIAAKRFCELLVSRNSLESMVRSGIAPSPFPELNRKYAAQSPSSALAVAVRSLEVSRGRPNLPEATQFIPVISSALNEILMGAAIKPTLDRTNHQITGIMQLSGRYQQ